MNLGALLKDTESYIAETETVTIGRSLWCGWIYSAHSHSQKQVLICQECIHEVEILKDQNFFSLPSLNQPNFFFCEKKKESFLELWDGHIWLNLSHPVKASQIYMLKHKWVLSDIQIFNHDCMDSSKHHLLHSCRNLTMDIPCKWTTHPMDSSSYAIKFSRPKSTIQASSHLYSSKCWMFLLYELKNVPNYFTIPFQLAFSTD